MSDSPIHPNFRRFAQPFGTAFWDNTHDGQLPGPLEHPWFHFKKRIADAALLRDANGNPPRIRFGVINNVSCNALVGRQEHEYCIGIFLPLTLRLWEITYGFLALRNTLTLFGEPQCEQERLPLPYPIGYNIRACENSDEVAQVLRAVNPQCRVRNMMASYMYGRVIEYIFVHEFKHIEFGHVDFFRAIKQYSHLCEFPNNNVYFDFEDSDSVLAEYHADLLAILNLFGNLIDGEHTIRGTAGAFRIAEGIALAWLGIVLTAFVWLMEARDLGTLKRQSTHPAPVNRLFFLRYAPLLIKNSVSHPQVILDAEVLVDRALQEISSGYAEYEFLSFLVGRDAYRLIQDRINDVLSALGGDFAEIQKKYGFMAR